MRNAVLGLTSMLVAMSFVLGCEKSPGESHLYRELNSKERAALGFVTAEPSADLKENENKNFQCYQSICSANQGASRMVSAGGGEQQNSLGQLEDLIEKKYSIEREQDQLIFRDVKKADLKELKLSSQAGDMFFGVFATMQIHEVGQYIVRSNVHGRLEVHREAYLKAHAEDPLRLTPAMLDVIDTYLQGNWMEINVSGMELWDAIRLFMGKDVDLKTKIKEMTERTLEVRRRALEAIGSKPGALLSAQKKALAMAELSSTEGKDLIKDYAQAELFIQLLDGDLVGIFKKSEFQGSAIHLALQKISLEKLQEASAQDQILNSAACKKSLARSLEGSVPPSQVVKFISQIEVIKGLVVGELSQLIKDSPAEMQSLSGKIKTLKLKLPEDRAQMTVAIAEFLDDEIQVSKSFLEAVKLDQNRLQLGYLIRAGRVMQAEKTGKRIQRPECDNFPVDHTSDFALSSMNKITVSPVAMRDFSLGFGILAHEMGHIVFKALTGTDGYMIPGAPVPPVTHPILICEMKRVKGNYRILNESFADSFSAHIMKKFRRMSQVNPRNYSCALIAQDASQLKLEDLESADTHPQNFFRLLSWQKVNQGRLAPVCEEVLASAGQSDLATCW